MIKFQKIDQRIADCIDLLEDSAQLDKIQSVLDIGAGEGQISIWFSEKGKNVVATGLAIDSYDIDKEEFRKRNIDIIECDVENMPFENESFDAVVLSHVLEHCLNTGIVLQEIKRVLKKGGFLFVFVPPYSNHCIPGHINNGWNLGQLIYVLLLNGYNVKDGKFIHYGYNVCAFVQSSDLKLPKLRMDGGDINLLYRNGLFPKELVFYDHNMEEYKGDIQSINWKKPLRVNWKRKIVLIFWNILSIKIRKKIIDIIKRVVDFLSLNTN